MGTLDPSALLRQRGLELSADLGALIAHERKQREWSQAELADKMGMRQSGIATYEAGSRQLGHLHVHIIEAFERVFKMPAGSILDRLGLVARQVDFETFILSSDLPERLKYAFRDLYRAFMAKDGLPDGTDPQ